MFPLSNKTLSYDIRCRSKGLTTYATAKLRIIVAILTILAILPNSIQANELTNFDSSFVSWNSKSYGVCETVFNGRLKTQGVMFNVVAKNDLFVYNFDLHILVKSEVTIEIYTAEGPVIDIHKDKDEWKKVGVVLAEGQGKNKVTSLQKNSFEPVYLKAGEMRSFYLTTTSGLPIGYSKGKQYGAITSSNDDMQILEGIGKKYPFKSRYGPRVFNGAVYYMTTKVGGYYNIFGATAKSLTTITTGRNTNWGAMFDVKAKKSLTITGMGIHVKTLDIVRVEVYTSSSSVRNAHGDPTEWIQIGVVMVRGQGRGVVTSLPEGSLMPTAMAKGGTRAFYVTLTDGPDMLFTVGRRFGRLYKQNDDLMIGEGLGKKYPMDKNKIGPRVWNGVLRYEI